MVADIQSAAGSGVRVVDSREGVANQAVRVEQQSSATDTGRIMQAADCSLFVTGFTQKKDADEYSVLCRNLAIPFGGVLSLNP